MSVQPFSTFVLLHQCHLPMTVLCHTSEKSIAVYHGNCIPQALGGLEIDPARFNLNVLLCAVGLINHSYIPTMESSLLSRSIYSLSPCSLSLYIYLYISLYPSLSLSIPRRRWASYWRGRHPGAGHRESDDLRRWCAALRGVCLRSQQTRDPCSQDRSGTSGGPR